MTDKEQEYTECPICHSKNIKNKWDNIRSINENDEKFSIVQCNNCDLYFIKQKVSSEYLDNFYNKNENEDENVYNDENLAPLRFYYGKLKNRIEKYVPNKGKILDVGCSGGYFLDIMEGWERYGCEISAHYSEIARQKYGQNIFEGTFEDYEQNDIEFDVITLQDCLDYMINPMKIISKCYELLKPNGLIVIKAHNIDCLFAKIWNKNFYAIIPPAHLFYFNKKSIINLLKLNNFNIKKYTYIPHILKLSTIFLRFAKGENGICYEIYNKLKDTMLGNIAVYKDLHDIFTVFATKSAD